jgi:His-Xaa-Ser system protein HxsD
VSETLRFSLSVFTADAVKRAVYRFIDRISPEIHIEGDEVVCELTFLRPVGEEAVRKLLADIRSEVLDQDLRARIAEETAGVRNSILALAFSETSLQERE